MSIIEATTVRVKTMADDTLRLEVDIEPRFVDEAFRLFGRRGQHIAITALKPGAVPIAEPDTEPDTELSEPVGPLCKLAVMFGEQPEFWTFLNERYQLNPQIKDEDGAAQWIRDAAGIESRRELDTRHEATTWFQTEIRLPYKRLLETGLLKKKPRNFASGL